jgi:hypothetical protein
MIAIMALVLLAAVALLLLYPESVMAVALRDTSARHSRLVAGVAILLGIVTAIGGLWPVRGDREAGTDGYAEVWYMVQTAPQMRDPARARLADGRLTAAELGELRTVYRQAPDVNAMRSGVVKELAR